MDRALIQDFKKIPLEKLGFEVNKIDFSSFKRKFDSIMN